MKSIGSLFVAVIRGRVRRLRIVDLPTNLTPRQDRKAVAQVSNLLCRGFPTRWTPARIRQRADWKSAIQQVGNLRYGHS